jgi:CheY-like chemotaxis protein
LQDLIMIMVVEDDQVIQALVEESLTVAGFETAIAASGDEAVALLRGDRSYYRALVTDINLLGTMDG